MDNLQDFSYTNDSVIINDTLKFEITLDQILEMPSESLLEKILEFSEEYNVDVSYIAEVFEKNKEWKALLYSDCVETGVINDPAFKEMLESRIKD